ncbi:hypothetical protein PIB30_032290 [Stylosanthes scabra]|uniref:Uncharacterized protein n=1 Tax=Stylosanthes scabra TaxID=79078 RepID=A0ABU6YCS3_9FABA|nr:hypothetical protein [Stylosanthes scabra]
MWCKDAKSGAQFIHAEKEDEEKSYMLRYGALRAASLGLYAMGAKSFALYQHTMHAFDKLAKELQEKCQVNLAIWFIWVNWRQHVGPTPIEDKGGASWPT